MSTKPLHKHERLAYSRGLDLSSRDSRPVHDRLPFQARPADIICGRGFHIANHHGNHNLHLIVNNHRRLYLASTREQKANIIKGILIQIKNSGARFIRSVSDGHGAEEWQEVDEATAYKKVSHALRLRKNESNRRSGAIAETGDNLQHRGDPSSDASNQVPLSHTEDFPAILAPSEKSTTSAQHHQTTVTANPTDIICGRGLHISNHRGNLNLHCIVNVHREEYLSASRRRKANIIKHIIDKIKSTGARFVRKVSDGPSAARWQVVDDETAYKKVSHALRLRTTNESNRNNGTLTAAQKLNPCFENGVVTMNQVRNGWSMSTDRPALPHVHVETQQGKGATKESQTPVQPNILNMSSELPQNLTLQNGPTVASAAAIQLWAAQLRLGQPTYEDLLRQQYCNALCSMVQQLSQQHHR